MPKLTARNFSVIKDAELEPGKVNVLIGPQSSGKSLICKLMHFFLEAISQATWSLAAEKPLKEFRKEIEDDFRARFPQNTWSGQEFELRYSNNKFEFNVVSLKKGDASHTSLTLRFSDEFEDTYQNSLHQIQAQRQAKSEAESAEIEPPSFEIYDFASVTLRALLEADERESQLFIPAGRSFFTTSAKSFASAESGALDRITSRFGRLVARALDEPPKTRLGSRRSGIEFDSISEKLLKGALDWESKPPTFKAEGGRSLLLSQLSSGAQELLPLILALRPLASTKMGRSIYIEEPEAHLFPSTQYELVKLLAWLAGVGAPSAHWYLTTHSPYILSAFNNLIYAGQLARQKSDLKGEVVKIVPEGFWIEEGRFRAYEIHDGVLSPILSESGLINGEYLDGVSNIIGNQFDSLLRLEYEHTEAS